MAKQGNTYAFKKNKLDELKDALKENLTLHITRSKIQRPGANLYFVAVERPTFRNPLEQAKANPRVLPNRRGNGLNEAQLRLLARLCAERATADEPELIVDEQLPPPPQMEVQNQQENAPTQAEEVQRRIPASRRRVLQELQLQASPERRTRTRRRGHNCSADEEPDLMVDEERQEPQEEQPLPLPLQQQHLLEQQEQQREANEQRIFNREEQARQIFEQRLAQQAQDERHALEHLLNQQREALWYLIPASTITKIFNRIPIVLEIIRDTNGDNDLVETRRGIIRAGD
jgi:hypothetical protein